MDIDRQRIAAARTLQALGYVFQGGEWISHSQYLASDPAIRERRLSSSTLGPRLRTGRKDADQKELRSVQF
jgi:hypothetical protein